VIAAVASMRDRSRRVAVVANATIEIIAKQLAQPFDLGR